MVKWWQKGREAVCYQGRRGLRKGHVFYPSHGSLLTRTIEKSKAPERAMETAVVRRGKPDSRSAAQGG